MMYNIQVPKGGEKMTQNTAIQPKSWRIFSGSGLKVLAMFAMLTDHIALHLLSQYELHGEKI